MTNDAILHFTIDTIQTPTGPMLIVTDQKGALRALEWVDLEERLHRLIARQYHRQRPVLCSGQSPADVRNAVRDYFDGGLDALASMGVAMGGTVFQRDVWNALREIPVGQTCSYRDIAIAIGNPKAVRAVGAANGANPVGIVVPCHRVIGANGALTGYGGGMARKEWLLRHEGAIDRLI
ncbi:MAG: methylated-DNA--[protein]-cysteine S-methyltransferase [Hyphomonadaceae bacterium]|nr:methylated-DNA--[protein]-cysteine S-methyltransferase [Hyphomonadaceae bacterium]